jgi:hypothetical protein
MDAVFAVPVPWKRRKHKAGVFPIAREGAIPTVVASSKAEDKPSDLPSFWCGGGGTVAGHQCGRVVPLKHIALLKLDNMSQPPLTEAASTASFYVPPLCIS